VAEDAQPVFVPLRTAPRNRLVVALVVGPLLWLVALVVAGVLIHRLDVIEIGLLVAAASFVVGAVVLLLGRSLRVREEHAFASRG